jgi:acyl-CoA dehydrogenase
MKRRLFKEEHEIFREQVRRFVEKEITPNYEQWERDGICPREIYLKAGAQGFLCPWVPEEYGGAGADWLYSVVILEELAGYPGVMFVLHSDVCAPYIYSYGTEAQKKKYLPGACTGENILAVAMTEPFAGSDLQAIRTTAVKKGDRYILNGSKTFISNGILNNTVIVAAKTDLKAEKAYQGMSLFLVEDGTKGYIKARKLEKIGYHSQDTAELVFEDCEIPEENLLGEEGKGFIYLMEKLQQERLVCAIGSVAGMFGVLDITKKYINERTAFGRTLNKFQWIRFKMAEMYTQAEIARAFVDRLIEEHIARVDVTTETCMAKWWTTEVLKDMVDECLQFFGGYGYMEEYPIARMYRDVRVGTIYAGTTEIMKELISRRIPI